MVEGTLYIAIMKLMSRINLVHEEVEPNIEPAKTVVTTSVNATFWYPSNHEAF